MFVFVTVGILLFAAATVLLLWIFLPAHRAAWLIAVGGGTLALISVFIWLANPSAQIQLPAWQPAALFGQSLTFTSDLFASAFALSIVALSLSILFTAVVRDNFFNPLAWSGNLALTALGVLAVTADNLLTLALIWAAFDLTELIIQFRFVEDPKRAESAITAFAFHALGILTLLWADAAGATSGDSFNFHSTTSQTGVYLLIAAGLRIGVLPLHLPYAGDSPLRRGFGTALRMTSAASSLILLARIPAGSIAAAFEPYLLAFTTLAAVYGGWMWLRAPDELTGRPFWLIGVGSLAVIATLHGNVAGAAAWSCALILCGGVLFLSSEPNRWLTRGLWVGAFGLSSLPFSLTASGWSNATPIFFLLWIPLLLAHVMLLTGFIRYISHTRIRNEDQPAWAKNIYPIGILLLLTINLLLGFFNWNMSFQMGNLIASLSVSFLTFILVRFTPRLRILNPVRAHWVRPTASTWLEWSYQIMQTIYKQTSRASAVLTTMLEGESGVMWMLVFVAFLISFFAQNAP